MRLGTFISGIVVVLFSACSSWSGRGDASVAVQRNALPTTSSGRDLWLLDQDGGRAMRVATHVTGPYAVEAHESTFKHFHHLYVPGTDTLLTKGTGGKFSHHRGLFAGWSQTRIADRVLDFWHGRDGARVEHVSFGGMGEAASPGGSTTSVSVAEWRDGDGVSVVRETRRVEVVLAGAARVAMDVNLTLEAVGGQVVELRGDPQHAGFQFRAAQELAERVGEAEYLRPEGAHSDGNDVWQDCGWAALVMPRTLRGGKQCEVLIQHIDGVTNPRPMVYSTRDYGRFGSFFEMDLRPGVPLVLEYRIFVADLGVHPEEASPARLQARADAFAAGLPARAEEE